MEEDDPAPEQPNRSLLVKVLTVAAWLSWFPGMVLPLVDLQPFAALQPVEELGFIAKPLLRVELSTLATLRLLRVSGNYAIMLALFLCSAVLPLLRLIVATVSQLGYQPLEGVLRRLAVLGSYQLLDPLCGLLAVAFCNSECFRAQIEFGFWFIVGHCILSQLLILMLLGHIPCLPMGEVSGSMSGMLLQVDRADEAQDENDEDTDGEEQALLGPQDRQDRPVDPLLRQPVLDRLGRSRALRGDRRTALANGVVVLLLLAFGSTAPLLDSTVTLNGVAFCRQQLGLWHVLVAVGTHTGAMLAVVLAAGVVALPLAVAMLGYVGMLQDGNKQLLRVGSALAPWICSDVLAVALAIFLFTAQGDHLRTEISAGSLMGISSDWFSGLYVCFGLGVAGFALKWKVLRENAPGDTASFEEVALLPLGGRPSTDYQPVAQDADQGEFWVNRDSAVASREDEDDEPNESEPLIARSSPAANQPPRASRPLVEELAATSLSQPLQSLQEDDGPVWEDWECPDVPRSDAAAASTSAGRASSENSRGSSRGGGPSPPLPTVPVAPPTVFADDDVIDLGEHVVGEGAGAGDEDPFDARTFYNRSDAAGGLFHISAASGNCGEAGAQHRGGLHGVEMVQQLVLRPIERINACGWWVLWMVMCLFVRSPAVGPLRDASWGLNKALDLSLPTINGLIRVGMPVTVGDCFALNSPPRPCRESGTLYQHGPRSDGWGFTVRWITGANTVWVEGISVTYIPQSIKPMQVQIRGFLERVNVSVGVQKCEDSPALSCQNLWDSSEACCERHRAFELALDSVCYEGSTPGQPGPAQLGRLETALAKLDNLGTNLPVASAEADLSDGAKNIQDEVQDVLNGLFLRERVFFNLTFSELITRLWQYNSDGVANRHCSDLPGDI